MIGNFSNEMLGLYHNEGNGLFIDEAPSSSVGQASLLTLTFAAFFFDYDLDAPLDIFSVGGHVADDIQKVQPKVSFAQAPHLFRNLGGRRFEDVASKAGADFARPMVSRGAAYLDADGDGDLDLVVTANGGPAVLLRNDGGNKNHWLRVRLVGHEVEPGRHRREGHGHAAGRRQELGRREDGLELLLAERAAAHLRPGRGRQGRGGRGGLAERPGRQARPAGRRPHDRDHRGARELLAAESSGTGRRTGAAADVAGIRKPCGASRAGQRKSVANRVVGGAAELTRRRPCVMRTPSSFARRPRRRLPQFGETAGA